MSLVYYYIGNRYDIPDLEPIAILLIIIFLFDKYCW